ncbi:MAG: tRNA lysidine(34) synthetase TilS [Oligoflexus sp.]|nr:tRNA lysidine(34) synthetase TilS [Oligoflexus sp.]
MPLREELYRFLFGSIEDLKPKADKYFLACSGGLDSMVLMDLFASWASDHQVSAEVLHVNYGLRAEESDGDEAFVIEQAKLRDLKTRVLRVDKATHPLSGIQDWARQIRYDWFATLCDSHNKVVLAHHEDDQVETILMRIVRGSGLSALQGMKCIQGVYWRPLLGLSRTYIQEIAQREKIPHREDSSNAKLDYSRNRIRKLILPNLEEMFPGTGRNLKELAEAGQQWAQFHDRILDDLDEPTDAVAWQNLGFYPASQWILNRMRRENWAKEMSRSWLETVYRGLIEGANTVVQLDPEHQVRLRQGMLTLERVVLPSSPRWQQFAKELKQVGLAALLSEDSRLESVLELDASSEMQDNKGIFSKNVRPPKRSL